MFRLFNRKDEDLKYDFLPSAIEIIEKPASPLGRIIIYIITIFIIIMITWACISEIDNIVISSGQVNPKDGVKVVDSNLNGKISKILKEEGDHVKAGDIILELENSNNDGQEEKIKTRIEEKKLELDIIKHKLAGNDFSNIYSKYNINKNKIEEIKLNEDIKKDQENKELNSYNESINTIEKDIKKLEKDIKELNDKYNKMDDVDKFISGNSIKNEIESNKNQIERLEKSKIEQKENTKGKEESKRLSYIKERNQAEEELKQLKENLDNIKKNNSNFVVRSPIDGIILSSNYNTIGSSINQSKTVAEIVPDNSELEIETFILNRDISRIKEGQEVVIKFESYDYQKYGTLEGIIEYISPNAFNNDQNGLVYKVKVKFDKNQKEKVKVLPGMVGTLEIKCDKMKIIDYFLEPFKKHIDNSLKG